MGTRRVIKKHPPQALHAGGVFMGALRPRGAAWLGRAANLP